MFRPISLLYVIRHDFLEENINILRNLCVINFPSLFSRQLLLLLKCKISTIMYQKHPLEVFLKIRMLKNKVLISVRFFFSEIIQGENLASGLCYWLGFSVKIVNVALKCKLRVNDNTRKLFFILRCDELIFKISSYFLISIMWTFITVGLHIVTIKLFKKIGRQFF